MENPNTWTLLERTIDHALTRARELHRLGFIGLSEVRIIADALREAGLVVEKEEDEPR